MKQVFLAFIMLLLFGGITETAHAQTTLKALFERVIRDENGIPISGLDVDLHLWGDTAIYANLKESLVSPGTYYVDSLEYGLYDIYVDGSLNQEAVFHGANKMNFIADKFTNDLVQLMTIGIKDSAVTWMKLSEPVKDSIRKRRIGDNIWGLLQWDDFAEAVKDSIRKDSIGGGSLAVDFLDSLIFSRHGIEVNKDESGAIYISFALDQSEKDTIYVHPHPDSTMTYAASRGNWLFKDSGCVRIYHRIGVDYIQQDTIITIDTLSVGPLVTVSDTSIGTRYVDIPDTLIYDASRCTGESSNCWQEFTVPIYEREIHRTSVQINDSIAWCDSICYIWNVRVRDTLYYEFDSQQMLELEFAQLGQIGVMCDTSRYSNGSTINICLKLMPNGKWLANLKEGIINYPYRACNPGTKCDTVYYCCINKHILNAYMAARNLTPISYIWFDSLKTYVDCQAYWGVPGVVKDTSNCITFPRTKVIVDTTYINTGIDTTVVVNVCDYKCPRVRVVKDMSGYYDSTIYYLPKYDLTITGSDTVLINANYQQFWHLDDVQLQWKSPSPQNPVFYNGMPKTFLDSLINIAGWAVQWDTLSAVYTNGYYSDSGYFHLGMVPLNYGTYIYYPPPVGWDYSQPPYYWNTIVLTCYWSRELWDAYGNSAPYPKNIYVWVPESQLDSMIQCSLPCEWWYSGYTYIDYGCGKDTVIIDYCTDVLNNTAHIDSITYWVKALDSECGFIIYPHYDTTLVGYDTLVVYDWVQGSVRSVIQITDTCAGGNRATRLYVPDGAYRDLVGDLYVRNDCPDGIQPYWDGNTLVLNYSGCGGGINPYAPTTTGGLPSPSPFTSPGLVPNPLTTNNFFGVNAVQNNYATIKQLKQAIAMLQAKLDSVGQIGGVSVDCCDSIPVLRGIIDSLEAVYENLFAAKQDSIARLTEKVDILEVEVAALQVSETSSYGSLYGSASNVFGSDSLIVEFTGSEYLPVTGWTIHDTAGITMDSVQGQFTVQESGIYHVTVSYSVKTLVTPNVMTTLRVFEAGGGPQVEGLVQQRFIDTAGITEAGCLAGTHYIPAGTYEVGVLANKDCTISYTAFALSIHKL